MLVSQLLHLAICTWFLATKTFLFQNLVTLSFVSLYITEFFYQWLNLKPSCVISHFWRRSSVCVEEISATYRVWVNLNHKKFICNYRTSRKHIAMQWSLTHAGALSNFQFGIIKKSRVGRSDYHILYFHFIHFHHSFSVFVGLIRMYFNITLTSKSEWRIRKRQKRR